MGHIGTACAMRHVGIVLAVKHIIKQNVCLGPLSVLLQKSLANSESFLLFFGVDPPPPTHDSDVCTFATKSRS